MKAVQTCLVTTSSSGVGCATSLNSTPDWPSRYVECGLRDTCRTWITGMWFSRQCESNRPTFCSAWGLFRIPHEGSSIAFWRSINRSTVCFGSLDMSKPQVGHRRGRKGSRPPFPRTNPSVLSARPYPTRTCSLQEAPSQLGALTPWVSHRCGSGKTPIPTHDLSGAARVPYAAKQRSASPRC